MNTGDGLLVRVHPPGGCLTAAQARLLADLARGGGNGFLNVTARGNIQIRGVREQSWPDMLDALDASGLAEPDGDGPHRLTLVSPLAGLDPAEAFDPLALSAAIEARARKTVGLSPKLFVALDAGGAFEVDQNADILVAASALPDHVAIGLAAPNGRRWIGVVRSAQAHESVAAILLALAAMRNEGRTQARRIRDLAPELAGELDRHANAASGEPAIARRIQKRSGVLVCADGRAALLALPFGRCDAAQLQAAAAWSERFGKGVLRLSFTRGLLVPFVTPEAVEALLHEAFASGFIVDPEEARLFIEACPGAPACAAAHACSSADAQLIAEAARRLVRAGATIHVSGCAKGCARHGRSDLTLVGEDSGRYGLVLGGNTRERTVLSLTLEEILRRLAEINGLRDLSAIFREAR